uniref:Uncharacterized protein n=1 Tax=Tanacetum cinerariifolium TaxID=118510 RepID=A0A6L2JYY4_TANCI|nr:hypothetical protein [Tanacetum cinerariifolium]
MAIKASEAQDKSVVIIIVGKKKFTGEAWSDSKDDDEPKKYATCLMVIDSQEVHPKSSISNNDLDIHKLQKENEELVEFNKDFMEKMRKFKKKNALLKVNIQNCVRNKMHKAFPLPAIKFPMPEELPTASEDGSHSQKKRDATARKIALISM